MITSIRSAIQRATIKVKLISALILLLILCLAGVTLFSLRRGESMVRTKELENYQFLANTVRSAMRQKFHEAETAALTLAHNPEIQRLFAERKREELTELLLPVYQALKPGVSQLQFHLPDSSSFLRLHFPEEFGDDLRAYRLLVNECNATKKAVSGLEEGIAGFGFRAVVPMTYQGRHTGSVEYGMDFGREFLSQLQVNLDGEYFIYRIVNGVVDMHVGTLKDDDCFIQAHQVDDILHERPVFKISDDRKTGFILIPFRRFNGKVQGFIKVVLDRRELARQLTRLTQEALLLGGGGILGLTVIFWGLIVMTLRPIPQIVAQTTRISAEISRGNFGFRGNVEDTSVDFQDIIAQINHIIQALRESEAQKQAILDAFPGMLAYVDRQFTIRWANKTMRNIHPTLIGAKCPEIMKDFSDNFCRNCLVEQAMRSKHTEKTIQVYVNLFGRQETNYWENFAVPIETNDEQSPGGCIRISWNITEQKRLEQLTLDLNRTLEERVRQEIEKRKEQEQKIYQQSKLAALGELAAGIAHEINQPLNTISFAMDNLFSKFRKQTMTEEYLQKKIAYITDDIHRIRMIIDHVRTFSREQHSELQGSFDMNESVEKALSLIRVQYENHQIRIERELAQDLPLIRGNLYQFEQIVLNFLSNAKDALEEKKRQQPSGDTMMITLRTYQRHEHICLEVEDTGIGIEDTHLSQILDPFYTTKEPDKGTGLGLSISYGLIKKMQGTLDVESRYGQGTVMRVCFPTETTLSQDAQALRAQKFVSQKELQPLVL